MGQHKKDKRKTETEKEGDGSIFKNGLAAEPEMILILFFTTQFLE